MLFKSEAGQRRIYALCDQHLARLTVSWQSRTVATRVGSTHVVVAGPPEAPPLLLLHAMGTHAGLFHPEINTLARSYRVLAPDIPGQPNRSAQCPLSPTDGSLGTWQTDVLDALGVRDVVALGISLGGYAALKLAEVAPGRVRAIALVCTAGLSAPPFLKVTPMLWSVAMGRLFGGPGWLERGFARASRGAPPESEFFTFLEEGARHYRLVVKPYPVFRPEQLAGFTAPALLLAGEHDPIYDVERQLAGAQRILRNVTAEPLLGLGHLFPNADRAQVAQRVVRFLDAVR